MNVLLVGPTGAGKTTVAREVAVLMENMPPGSYWYYIISGDIARAMASEKDKADFSAGKLFSDERLMRWKVLHYINDRFYNNTFNPVNMVIDGFPRTRSQLMFTIAACVPIDIAFYLNVTMDEAVARIKSRRRDDVDTEETVKNRITNESPDLLDLWSAVKWHGIEHYWIDTDNHNSHDVATLIVSKLRKRYDTVSPKL